jgi:hypothetical protein
MHKLLWFCGGFHAILKNLVNFFLSEPVTPSKLAPYIKFLLLHLNSAF